VLNGVSKDRLVASIQYTPTQPKLANLITGSFISKHMDGVRGSGYCVESLEAALWCFFNTSDFERAVLTAANLGDDADTTAAIVGQMAGAYYGVSAIPKRWRALLTMAEDIEDLAGKLYERAQPAVAGDPRSSGA
jgi:ADP-ribosyl-[dinitrogen reductase] hydrolase